MKKNNVLVKFGKNLGVGAVVSSLVLCGVLPNTVFAARTLRNSSSNSLAGHTPNDRAPRSNDACREDEKIVTSKLKKKLDLKFSVAVKNPVLLKAMNKQIQTSLVGIDIISAENEEKIAVLEKVFENLSLFGLMVIVANVYLNLNSIMNDTCSPIPDKIIDTILGYHESAITEKELRKRIISFVNYLCFEVMPIAVDVFDRNK